MKSRQPLVGELTCLGQERVQSCVVQVLIPDDGRHQHELGFPAGTRIDVIEGLAGEGGHDHALCGLRVNLACDLGGTRACIADELDDPITGSSFHSCGCRRDLSPEVLGALIVADQAQAPPELHAALSAITHHGDDYANHARHSRRVKTWHKRPQRH